MLHRTSHFAILTMERNSSKRDGLKKKEKFSRPINGETKIQTINKPLISFANFRYIVECLIANIIVISMIVFTLPLIIFFFVLKKIEYYIAYCFDKTLIPLNGEDSLWQQSSAINRTIITTVLILERPKDEQKSLKKFSQVVYERLIDLRDDNGKIKFPRAKQIIRPGFFQYFFTEDEHFNVDNHVFQYNGRRPKTKGELEDIVSTMSAEPLPDDKPPWLFCFIPTEFEGNKDAVVFRIHHSMADGVSLCRFLTRVLPDHYIPQEETKKFSYKSSSYDKVLIFLKAVFILARISIGQFLRFPDSSLIHGPELTGKKKCTWSEPLDLNLVKRIKNATGTTVNDVLVACLTMAVRRYHKKHGVDSPQDFIASIPVDVGQSKEIKFQNKFAIVLVKLPSSCDGALHTLFETKSRIDSFKHSGEPFAIALWMRLSGFLPEIVTKPLNSFISRKVTCALSNVPGPQYFLSVSGNQIKSMTFWPPQRNNIGIGLSIFSYAGQIIIGVQGDEAVLRDPETITKLFEESMQELASCVLD